MAIREQGDQSAPALVWERPEPSRPSPLSRDRIVTAAIGLADAGGIASVSLRRVSAVLDAGPMRLYAYISTKEELLDLMADAVYGEITPSQAPGGDWRAAVRDLAHRTRQAALRHEWFVELAGGRPNLGPHALDYLEAFLSALGLAPGDTGIDSVLQAARTVQAYVIGAIRAEITEMQAERLTGTDEYGWQVAAAPYVARMLATGRYPTLANVVHNATHPGGGTIFADGLDSVLDGIGARR